MVILRVAYHEESPGTVARQLRFSSLVLNYGNRLSDLAAPGCEMISETSILDELCV